MYQYYNIILHLNNTKIYLLQYIMKYFIDQVKVHIDYKIRSNIDIY